MLCHQQGKIGVGGLTCGVFVAVTVDGDDAVGIFVDYGALGVHAEGTDEIAVLLGAVDDLAFVQLIGEVGENLRGKLHPNADVHPVGLGGNVHVTANGFHPFAAAAPHGDHALAAREASGLAGDLIPAVHSGHGFHRRVKVKRDLVFQIGIEIFQHHIVDVGAEMAHGGVQQMEVVLHTQLFEFGAGGGIKLGAFAAVGHVDLVDVAHQLQRPGLAQILVKRAAKIVGNVVFSVGKSACAAETAHNGAAFAGNTGFDLNAVNGTFAVFQRMSGLEDGDFQFRAQPGQLIGGKDTARPRADNDHIVIHDYLTTYNFAVNHLRWLVETLNHIMSLYPSSITQPKRVCNQNRLRKNKGANDTDKRSKKSQNRYGSGIDWWGRTDSNHRSETQQIYSLSPLATRELPHILFVRLQAQGMRRFWWSR